MTTTVTHSIGTSGRDYSTLQAWEDALPASLVTADTQQIGECYNDSEFTGASPLLTMSGVTTDATRNIILRCAAGHSFYDNANKLNNAQYYDQSKGVGIKPTGGSGKPVQISTLNVTVDGLQINDGTVGAGCISQSGASSNTVFKNLVLLSSNTGTFGALDLVTGKAVNTLAVNTAGGSAFVSAGTGGTGSVTFDNCTAASTSATNLRPGFRGNYDAPIATNCGSFGFANGAFAASGSAAMSSSSDYCCSDDTTGPGAHSLHSKTMANQFVNATNDFRVKAGADLIGAGTRDAANTGDLDIIKQARSVTTPTIGAWEFISASPSAANLSLPTLGAGIYQRPMGGFAS